MESVGQRLEAVRERIVDACADAGRPPQDVRLIAVSKTVPLPLVREALAAGQTDFGENRMQEALPKVDALPDASWHFVGRLQSNKAKFAARFSLIQSLDRESLLRALARAGSEERPIACLLEVNLGGERQKGGASPNALRGLLTAANSEKTVTVRGLMTVPPAGVPARPYFAHLRALRDALEQEFGVELPELSMGMSADFEDGIREGATMVRVGTAIFGRRR